MPNAGTRQGRPRVVYVFPILHHFRAPFHCSVRTKLASQGIDYHVYYSDPFGANVKKSDTVDLDWATKTRLSTFPGVPFIFQHALSALTNSDLIVVQQENRLLFNYLCHIASGVRLRKFAYFGHGRNYQAHNPASASELFKRFLAVRCDWWFAYTRETQHHLLKLGFPQDKITVFNNAVDTTELLHTSRALTDTCIARFRNELGVSARNLGIYVGGLYKEKRLDFLVSAADRIRSRIPDFELVVVGGGPDEDELKQLALSRPWLKLTGPLFGRDKVAAMRLAKLFLMPGLVGLAILDAGALGLPTITTAYPYHSPEIAYLQPGRNGLIVEEWQDVDQYANAVVALLSDSDRLHLMSSSAQELASNYSIDKMAQAFAQGVATALAHA